MIESVRGRLLRDERGAGLVEYIILIGVVALLCIGAFKAFGDAISRKITGQSVAVESIPGEESGLGATTGGGGPPPGGGSSPGNNGTSPGSNPGNGSPAAPPPKRKFSSP